MRLALALALPLLGLAACQAADGPRVKPDEVLLQVVAPGRAEVAPDEARITVGVSSTAPTARAAGSGNAQAMARVSLALDAFGVKPADVQTRNVSLSRIDYGPQKGQYRAENLAEIRLRDVSRAGEAIAAATAAGGNVVAGPNLRVSNPEAADNAAYASAYKAASARAETYAKAAGLKVERILAIRDAGGAAVPMADGYGYARAEAANQSAAPVSAGADVREVRVQVDFALKK